MFRSRASVILVLSLWLSGNPDKAAFAADATTAPAATAAPAVTAAPAATASAPPPAAAVTATPTAAAPAQTQPPVQAPAPAPSATPAQASATAPPVELPDIFRKFRTLKQNLKISDAMKVLQERIKVESDLDRKDLESLLLGVTYYQQNNDNDAQAALTASMGSRLDDYANYFLGLSLQRSGKSLLAKKAFLNVLNSRAPDPIMVEAKFNLGVIAIQEKNYAAADQEFRAILKKWRRTEKYPDVLWQQMRVQRYLHQQYCKSAREIYSRFPSYPLAKDWSYDLAKNEIDSNPTRCSATPKEQQQRIKYLQFSGDTDKAMNELRQIRAEMVRRLGPQAAQQRAPRETNEDAASDSSEASQEDDEPLVGLYSVDAMIAHVLLSQGKIDEAFKLLLGYYEQQKHRSGYLLLLSKAAARLGEYQAAASAFDRIYHLSPRSKAGQNALFQAAFLSYQFQDYDGATRKFEEFIKNFPKSSMARDSQWHLAWLRYLKADYAGAYDGFMKIATQKSVKYKYIRVGRRGHRRRRRIEIPTDTVTPDRAKYWMAMSLLRMDRAPEARVLFEALTKDASISYYAVASYYRLANFPTNKVVTPVPSAAQGQPAPAAAAVAAATPTAEEESDSVGEDMAAQEATTVPNLVEDEVEADDKVLTGKFRDPFLNKRFERAQILLQLGLDDLCRLELGEIEKSSKTNIDRRHLMEQYQNIQSYFRSSYLGEVSFSAERVKGGIAGARPLWEYAYPRAYDNLVVPSAHSMSIPEELVWAIMRAESHYRGDARSPVGALGLMQLMPFTAKKVADLAGFRDYGVDHLIEPETNIRLGARYLQRLNEKYQYVPLVAAAYNAGPHRVASWLKSFGLLDMDEFIEHIPFVETRNYVKRVVRNFQIYALLYSSKGKIVAKVAADAAAPDYKNSGASRTLKWLAKPVAVKITDANAEREVW